MFLFVFMPGGCFSLLNGMSASKSILAGSTLEDIQVQMA